MELTGKYRRLLVAMTVLLVLLPGVVRGGEGRFATPTGKGLAVNLGHAYDPSPVFNFWQLAGILQYDYEQVWRHSAPEPLFFKVEGALGVADRQEGLRLVVSANIIAQYYLADAGAGVRPYVEAGIGLIYTGFRVEGQGLNLNFNPQAGIGFDLAADNGAAWFCSLRAHHLSNGDLYRDNRGVNSVVMQVGRYF